MKSRKTSQTKSRTGRYAGIILSSIAILFSFSSCKKEHDDGMLLLAPLLGGSGGNGGGGGGVGSGGNGGGASPPPSSTPAPTGVSATGSNRTVTVTWGAVSGATAYNLYWSTTSGVTKATGTKITGVTSPYTHTALTNGNDYSYIVTAVGSGGESNASAEVTAYPYLRPPKTYQTTSYAAGDDGAIQAGRAVSISGPVNAGGGEFISTDNDTGLTWKTCSEGLSGATCATGTVASVNWATASGAGTGCDALNGGFGFAGKTGWRIPTIQELATIIKYGATQPAIYGVQFPGTTVANYWSTTPDANTGTSVWGTNFFDGYTSTLGTGILLARLRCVTGPVTAPATSRYRDNGDGTVTDKQTALIWQKCSMGQNNDASCTGMATMATWTGTLTYCSGLSLAGRTWRLPNINELRSIVDYTTLSPAIDSTAFPATATWGYWSSTTDALSSLKAWYILFVDGWTLPTPKTSSFNVRCVSSGP